ncbi:MotA/TolQ/ExbB proton channel family protein [Sulfuriroseicoccus oceanibius]|uniref:MotA/TolQ/ExbB proton channel family protein n=1 Tax=Sulfuriroseicoccus oceanibius TaxID=2707525 RepID=A0A6B3L6I1_9BACT|nr:MotA/TolQ/ExbB proton channel family protein [Sulfuriroseicoccus oceanibius]QQL46323.1 MotA/TolQ/ExbB proton channel family protein [Sulfuriroseicoccus oceanibius]
MAAWWNELRVMFDEGGFALWGLVVISIVLFTMLANAWATLIPLLAIRKRGLPDEIGSQLELMESPNQVSAAFAGFELDKVAYVQRRVPFIGVLVAAAPLTGLLGTVAGMLVTFAGLATGGNAAPIDKISNGISQALVTTQAGLVVSIPAAFLLGLLAHQLSRVEAMLHSRMYQARAAVREGA